jgi:hypothetical protein
MTADRKPDRRGWSGVVVEAIVVIVVVVAIVAMAVWFFFFADSPLAPYN